MVVNRLRNAVDLDQLIRALMNVECVQLVRVIADRPLLHGAKLHADIRSVRVERLAVDEERVAVLRLGENDRAPIDDPVHRAHGVFPDGHDRGVPAVDLTILEEQEPFGHMLKRRHGIKQAVDDQRARHAVARLRVGQGVGVRVIPEEPRRMIRRKPDLVVLGLGAAFSSTRRTPLRLGDDGWLSKVATVVSLAAWISESEPHPAITGASKTRSHRLMTLSAGHEARLVIDSSRAIGVQRHAAPRVPERARSRNVAALINAKCVNACGKLPRCSPLDPSCSEYSPKWFAYPSIFSNSSCARSV